MGGGGGIPNSVFIKKIVLIRDSISEISLVQPQFVSYMYIIVIV